MIVRPWVIKLGGEVLDDLSKFREFAEDLKALHDLGRPLMIVHGGGAQATALMGKLGQDPTFVGGRRVTDGAALETVKMVISGQVSVDLCAILVSVGLSALGLNGVSAALIQAKKRPPRVVRGGGSTPVDFGFVGDVTNIRKEKLQSLMELGFVPVMACVASDGDGQVLNINADVVATDLAVALGADMLVALSSVPGVLADPEDPTSRFPCLDRAEVLKLLDQGVIAGGMVAKMDEALRALKKGVPRVVVSGPVGRGILSSSTEEPRTHGTEIVEKLD